jgi:hypothetical protein
MSSRWGRGSTSTAHITASTRREVATTAWSTWSAAATHATTLEREVAGTETAFLDVDILTVDFVGVGSDSSLESSDGLEVDKGAVLQVVSLNFRFMTDALPSGG